MFVEILPSADIDLFEIWDFIADDNFAHADKMVAEIHKVFSILADNPAMGRKRTDLGPNLRSFPVGNYMIYYETIRDGIRVLRVLHGARDVPDLFERSE